MYKGESMLKKAAMNILIKISKFEEVEAMEKHFKIIDKNGSGTIDVKELKAYFQKFKQKISHEELENMIRELDFVVG